MSISSFLQHYFLDGFDRMAVDVPVALAEVDIELNEDIIKAIY